MSSAHVNGALFLVKEIFRGPNQVYVTYQPESTFERRLTMPQMLLTERWKDVILDNQITSPKVLWYYSVRRVEKSFD